MKRAPGPIPPIPLILLDANRLLREGIAKFVRDQPDLKLVAACADATEAVRALIKASPAVFLMDARIDDLEGVRLTAAIREQVPTARVVLTGLHADDDDVGAFMRAGASGFIMRDASVEEFLRTVRTVAAGEEVLPPRLVKSLFKEAARRPRGTKEAPRDKATRLTVREREVMECLVNGQSNKQIAATLHITVQTAKRHVHSILEKLSLHSRFEVPGLKKSAYQQRH